jgi:selenide,water dikinase
MGPVRILEDPMSTSSQPTERLTSLSRGAGCACKLPLPKLEALFAALGGELDTAAGDLLVGAPDGDDAGVYRLDAKRALILTTDFFTPIVDDPRDWGRIAATNALSDVYAMGGKPLIAVNLTAWPGNSLSMDLLVAVLSGGADIARQAGCSVVGGHTIDDPIPKYGMAVVGIAQPDRLFRIDRLVPGDTLVLTKPLGTGVISTAIKNQGAQPEWVDAAVTSMTRLNADASMIAHDAGIVAATDVTGFGLLGHLHRMARASGCAAEIYANALPLLPGAREAVAAGFVPGGTQANTEHLAPMIQVDAAVPADLAVLAHDAQTSGGLLLGVSAQADAASVAAKLRIKDPDTSVVGRVTAGPVGHVHVRVGNG